MRPARRTSQGWQVKGKEGTFKRVGAKTARKLQTRAASIRAGRNVRQADGGWQVEKKPGSSVYGRAGGKTARKLDQAGSTGGRMRKPGSAARRPRPAPPAQSTPGPMPGGGPDGAPSVKDAPADSGVKSKLGSWKSFAAMHKGPTNAALAGAFRKRQGLKLNTKMKKAMAETAKKREAALRRKRSS